VGEICDREDPPLQQITGNHRLYCHIPRKDLEKIRPVIRYAGEDAPVV
jgi:hypothetical protein